MLRKILIRMKPGVPRQTHLFMAALLWTVVGGGLMVRGTIMLTGGDNNLYFPVGILIGTLKSLFILDKTAKNSIDRIQRLADGSCLGAVYSIRTWLLVVVMMSLGYVLRNSGVSPTILGTLYITIGWALLFSSRFAWVVWRKINLNPS